MSYDYLVAAKGEAKSKLERITQPVKNTAKPARLAGEAVKRAIAKLADVKARPSGPQTKIVSASWSKTDAFLGEEVTLKVELEGPLPSQLHLAVYEHDGRGSHDFIRVFKVSPDKTTVEVPWLLDRYIPDDDDLNSKEELAERGQTLPEFMFVATDLKTSKDSGEESGKLLKVADSIDYIVMDEITGKPMKGAKYKLVLEGGEEKEGELDDEGRIHVEKVPPGKFWLEIAGGDVETFSPEQAEVVGLDPDDDDDAPVETGGGEAELVRGRAAAIGSVIATPTLVKEGEVVEVTAEVFGVEDGEPGVMRFKKAGSDDVLAEEEGKVLEGKLVTTWTLDGVDGELNDGFPCADYDVEVEVAGVQYDTLGVPEFRGWKDGEPIHDALRLVLDIDPDEPESFDDKVTVTGDDGYEKTLGVKSEGEKHEHDEGKTVLVFEEVQLGKHYTCVVDPGKEGPAYTLFRDVALQTEHLD